MLAVERCGVVEAKKIADDLRVAYRGRVELDENRLGMTGSPPANRPVIRPVGRPAGVADLGVDHTVELLEQVLHSPEAACCKNRSFGGRGRFIHFHALSRKPRRSRSGEY